MKTMSVKLLLMQLSLLQKYYYLCQSNSWISKFTYSTTLHIYNFIFDRKYTSPLPACYPPSGFTIMEIWIRKILLNILLLTII